MPHHRDVVRDVSELNREVCRRIWRMASVGMSPSVLAPRLIIPESRRPEATAHAGVAAVAKMRHSEQEARFAYAETLTMGGVFYYSVETPTQKRYRQSGSTELSARSDMSLYLPSERGVLEHSVNVELKLGNCPQKDITKDIEKLVREDFPDRQMVGNWFHILPNTDRETINTLFQKFRHAFKEVTNCVGSSRRGRLSIVFCVCVLGDNRRAFTRHFECPNECAEYSLYYEKFFENNVAEDLAVGLQEQGWKLCRDIEG